MSVEDDIKHKVWFYEKVIPENVCDLIINEFDSLEYEYGRVNSLSNDTNVNTSIRFVKKISLPRNHWSLGILFYFGCDANTYNFKYNVSSLGTVDFLKYEDGMYYKPHSDVGSNVKSGTHNRKLTAILQLSDENDYDGGDILIYDSQLKVSKLSRKKGSILVFDSSVTHAVTKIKSGIRYSLCGWICGPPFS